MVFHILKEPGYGSRLITEAAFGEGYLIAQMVPDAYLTRPTRVSLQIAADRHIEGLNMLAHLNHSCAPNTYVDVDVSVLAVVAAQEVAAGDELTFFYPSTEWEMACPFVCRCGTDECLGQIAGAKTVPTSILTRYRLSPHICALLAIDDEQVASALRPVGEKPTTRGARW